MLIGQVSQVNTISYCNSLIVHNRPTQLTPNISREIGLIVGGLNMKIVFCILEQDFQYLTQTLNDLLRTH